MTTVRYKDLANYNITAQDRAKEIAKRIRRGELVTVARVLVYNGYCCLFNSFSETSIRVRDGVLVVGDELFSHSLIDDVPFRLRVVVCPQPETLGRINFSYPYYVFVKEPNVQGDT